jgi:NAD(P)-dependent dehydrogenase (short-subunit alcohol dehydrogenase family)
MKLKDEVAQRLRGKVAVITGAGGTNSLGRSIAIRYAEEGAKVAVLSTDGSSAQLVADDVNAGGGTAMAVACDVTDFDQCAAMAKQVAEAWDGKIDILVNNAGAFKGFIKGWKPFVEWTTEEWDHSLNVNLRGMFFCAKAVFPYMQPQGYGKIINIASSVFFEAAPGIIPYTTSKGGVIAFTRGLGKELGAQGIRVNAIAPGYCMTEGGIELSCGNQEFLDARRSNQALNQRNGVADDIAGPAFFLASEDSDHMTCGTILVDGGGEMW